MERIYEDWLKAFVDYASFGEAPLSFYYWVGVSAIAGALRRRVWIDQGYFRWAPNFYIILVAPPGIVSKSTTASIGMNLLRRVKGVKFGPDVVTWQKLAQSLAQSLELFDLGNGTMMPMSAVTIESSEFGTFLNPNDREMVDVLVSLWDGKQGTFIKSTKTQGEDVIEKYADEKRNYVAYPKLALPSNFDNMGDNLVIDLERISLLKGSFTITADALRWGEKWYEDHFKHKPPHLDNDRFGGYLARKQTHIHKLAMVLSASTRSDLIIDRPILARANDVITSLELDMPKVFAKIGTSAESRGAAQLVSLVHSHGKITQPVLYRELFRTLSYDDFTRALNSAVQAGHVEPPQVEGNVVWIKAKHEKTNAG